MTAGERGARQTETQRARGTSSGSGAVTTTRKPRASRAASQPAVEQPVTPKVPRTRPGATPRAPRNARVIELPSVAPCLELETLRALGPDEARRRVNAYLYDVMPGEDADAFEAMNYRWELHLVDIEQMRMVRGVELDPKKVRRYTAALRRGGGFPALVGLGGEGKRAPDDILLCDGYHRVAAMRRAGIYYGWAWLAVDLWRPAHADSPVELTAATR